ncbi:hypothetical protein MSG28_002974 [Choristoneura fumiferana]|uniref:Uncharacterized protein n=1 Tax=Choristoneura fumiferana TaxID=7141 RepID=A0ACC0JJZ5_CHOFU|nr:hypothetical protein MSG28_002974 [Choristoneura fumiferana]
MNGEEGGIHHTFIYYAGGSEDLSLEGAARRPRRYLYDPHSPLCRALVCARREECVLRDAGTALCADRARLLRNGDVVVNANESDGETRVKGDPESDWSRDDDVFYETAPESREPGQDRILEGDRAAPESDRAGHCVGCGSVPRAQFLCGSDNRTYSSLCRLDLHNCVRRPAPPVSLACRGFCPCAAPAPPARVRSRPRARAHSEHRDHDARDEHDSITDEPKTVRKLKIIQAQLMFQEWRRRGRRRNRRPSAIRDNAIPARRRPAEGEGCALDKMADRLLDWFSVLMGDAGASPPDRRGFPRDCKPETRWMFAHLDTDNDDLLSSAELYALRHDDRERCLRPFLASCGAAGEAAEGGEDAGVTRAAWCGCLRRAARPCTALARAHAAAPGLTCRRVTRRDITARGSAMRPSVSAGDKLSANAISLSNETGEEAQDAQEARDRGSRRSHEAHETRGAPSDDEDALASGSGDSELRF